MTTPDTAKGSDGQTIERMTVVEHINRTLLETLERIPSIDNTAEAAALWVGADSIKKNLSTIVRDVSERIVQLAPVDKYKYRGEERTRPRKEQVIEGVGIVKIENSADRTWHDLRTLAKALVRRWRIEFAKTHGGEFPSDTELVDFIFDVFAVGDPRVTKLKELGYDDVDKVDEEGDGEWVNKSFHQTVRVTP